MKPLFGGFRWSLFLAFLALSMALTILFWPRFIGLFLVFPFVLPWAWGRRSEPAPARALTCPGCGWPAQSPDQRFCPRDGTRLA